MNALRKADFGGEDTERENTIKTSSNSKAPTGINIIVLVKLTVWPMAYNAFTYLLFSLLKEMNSEVKNLQVVIKRF